MPKIFTFQPSDRTDHITPDGTELTQRPYPIAVADDGTVISIHGGELLGFADDLAVERIDHRWADVRDDPQEVVGKYAVIRDAGGVVSVHLNAIMTVGERNV